MEFESIFSIEKCPSESGIKRIFGFAGSGFAGSGFAGSGFAGSPDAGNAN